MRTARTPRAVQEVVLAARQAMDEAYRSLRHLLPYIQNVISRSTPQHGADAELHNLLMRFNFNGWYSSAQADGAASAFGAA